MRLPMVLLLCLSTLSGCAGSAEESPSTTETTTTPTKSVPTSTTVTVSTTQGTSTNPTNPSGNERPVPTLVANIQSGRIPFNVTFTIGGTDKDKDALGYTMDFGDASPPESGSGLETGFTQSLVHEYKSEGVYNATLTLSDGKTSATAWLVINATAVAIQAGTTYSCRAELGGAVGGLLGPNVVTISGCNLATAEVETVYASEEVPSGCSVAYDVDGDGFSEGAGEVGATYPAGTNFFATCGPVNPQGEVSITLIP
jgi:hypothetical protein